MTDENKNTEQNNAPEQTSSVPLGPCGLPRFQGRRFQAPVDSPAPTTDTSAELGPCGKPRFQHRRFNGRGGGQGGGRGRR